MHHIVKDMAQLVNIKSNNLLDHAYLVSLSMFEQPADGIDREYIKVVQRRNYSKQIHNITRRLLCGRLNTQNYILYLFSYRGFNFLLLLVLYRTNPLSSNSCITFLPGHKRKNLVCCGVFLHRIYLHHSCIFYISSTKPVIHFLLVSSSSPVQTQSLRRN